MTGSTTPSPAGGVDPRTAAWVRLQEGNRRWAAGRSDAGSARGRQRREDLVAGQAPFAAVLGCADSRIPPEILFDQGLGDLFVVRTAGHVVDDSVLGSLEYAVDVVGVDLVLVLGHDGCGAVAATAGVLRGGPVPGGFVRTIVDRLGLDVSRGMAAGLHVPLDLSRWCAGATLDHLQRSDALRAAVFDARIGLMAATYGLRDGLVEPVGVGPSGPSTAAVTHGPAVPAGR